MVSYLHTERLIVWWAFFVLFLLELDASAQHEVRYLPFKEAVKNKSHWVFFGDSRNSFLNNTPLKIQAVKAGLEWSKTWQIGCGISYLNLGQIESVKSSYALGLNPFVGYHFDWGKYMYSLPIQLNVMGAPVDNSWKGFVSYEAALIIERKFWNWVVLGAGMGYRIGLYASDSFISNASAPVYLIKLGVDFKYIRNWVHGRF